jgi:hypothetical protein
VTWAGRLEWQAVGQRFVTLPGTSQGVPRVTWPDVADALLRHTS